MPSRRCRTSTQWSASARARTHRGSGHVLLHHAIDALNRSECAAATSRLAGKADPCASSALASSDCASALRSSARTRLSELPKFTAAPRNDVIARRRSIASIAAAPTCDSQASRARAGLRNHHSPLAPTGTHVRRAVLSAFFLQIAARRRLASGAPTCSGPRLRDGRFVRAQLSRKHHGQLRNETNPPRRKTRPSRRRFVPRRTKPGPVVGGASDVRLR